MQDLLESLKCLECQNILEKPVVLPCGDFICMKHLKPDSSEHLCTTCDILHAIPNGGFRENKTLAKLLKTNIHEAKFCKEYENAYVSFKNLEKTFEESKLFNKDPYLFINKTVSDLKMEVDILREEFKLKIDEKADALIKEMDEYEQECKGNLNSVDSSLKFEEMAAHMERVKVELQKWKTILDSFSPNEHKWKSIEEESEKLAIDLEVTLNEYKQEALLNKLYDYQLRLASFTKIDLKSDRKYDRPSAYFRPNQILNIGLTLFLPF
jgi:hypothetical protein